VPTTVSPNTPISLVDAVDIVVCFKAGFLLSEGDTVLVAELQRRHESWEKSRPSKPEKRSEATVEKWVPAHMSHAALCELTWPLVTPQKYTTNPWFAALQKRKKEACARAALACFLFVSSYVNLCDSFLNIYHHC
jgi:hypothetical protein